MSESQQTAHLPTFSSSASSSASSSIRPAGKPTVWNSEHDDYRRVAVSDDPFTRTTRQLHSIAWTTRSGEVDDRSKSQADEESSFPRTGNLPRKDTPNVVVAYSHPAPMPRTGFHQSPLVSHSTIAPKTRRYCSVGVEDGDNTDNWSNPLTPEYNWDTQSLRTGMTRGLAAYPIPTKAKKSPSPARVRQAALALDVSDINGKSRTTTTTTVRRSCNEDDSSLRRILRNEMVYTVIPGSSPRRLTWERRGSDVEPIDPGRCGFGMSGNMGSTKRRTNPIDPVYVYDKETSEYWKKVAERKVGRSSTIGTKEWESARRNMSDKTTGIGCLSQKTLMRKTKGTALGPLSNHAEWGKSGRANPPRSSGGTASTRGVDIASVRALPIW